MRTLILAIGAFIFCSSFLSLQQFTGSRRSWSANHPITETARRNEIAIAFQHAWDGYGHSCFGHDTLHPVTNTCDDGLGGYGATAIDALSTAIILGNEAATLQILKHIERLDFKAVRQVGSIGFFQLTTRHLGSMLSAWDLLNGPFSHMAKDAKLRQALQDHMLELGELLSSAFDTESGVPLPWIDPVAGKGRPDGDTSVAAAGAAILEFARLSDITGNPKFVALARKAEENLLKPQPRFGEPFPGLLGSSVAIAGGAMVDGMGSWGAQSDSFYEYLLKAYLYDSDQYSHYLDRWLLAADSTIQHIGSHPYGHPEWTLLPTWNGEILIKRMDSLAWFAGGNFILGGMVTNNQTLIDYGLSLADTANAVYEMTTTGLGPELVTWATECDKYRRNTSGHCQPDDSITISDERFRLRPEVLETWYYAYRATKDPKYRQWSWNAWTAIQRFCLTESGYAGLEDVNLPQGGKQSDEQMETSVLAAVMKYVFLTQLDDDTAEVHVQDSRAGVNNSWVFNTEGHPLRVAGRPQ